MTVKKEHPFAEALRWVAAGETLQASNGTGYKFCDIAPNTALMVIHNHCMGPLEFRIKPRTIRIGAYDVPEPMREIPENGAAYYALRVFGSESVIGEVWRGDDEDFCVIKKGMCWLKREDAELAAKAIRELLTGATE